MTPRIATRADEPEIMRLLHMMHEECGMLSLDEDCARETFNLSFDRKGGIIGVIGEPNNIKAMICLLITRFWYTKDNHLEELFNYVRPDARGDDHAKTLITFAKDCAEKIRIPLVIGVLTNKQVSSKVRLYRRVLGTPAGAFFVYNRPQRWASAEQYDEDFWQRPFPTRKDERATEILSILANTAPDEWPNQGRVRQMIAQFRTDDAKAVPMPVAMSTAAMVGMM